MGTHANSQGQPASPSREAFLDEPPAHDSVIRVGRPYFPSSDFPELTEKIARLLESGWLTNGITVRTFEAAFRRSVGTRYAIAVNSGTAALHTIMAFLRLKDEDEVVVPANTFVSTANAVSYVGATLVLADCDMNTFNVTAESLAQMVTDKTKAVAITHIGGNPCEMDEIVRLCKEEDIALIEDSAHALGSKYRGRQCGSFGMAGAFSFYPTKLITAGEGGMITTNARKVNNFGVIFRNAGRQGRGDQPVKMLGYNYRLGEINAVIGLAQLGHLNEFVRKRNQLAKIYDEELEKLDWIVPQQRYPHALSSFYVYATRIASSSKVSRNRLVSRLRTKGIETTVMFRPVHSQPYYRARLRGQRSLKNSELIGKTELTLPIHAAMTEEQVQEVVREMRAVAS